MRHARRAWSVFVVLILITSAAFARQGSQAALKPDRVHASSVGALAIYFSGSFSYSFSGGTAILKADNVSNTNTAATGPLRFSLWMTTSPYPASGYNTASYAITNSLAAGQSIAPVNGGSATVPFTLPSTGCYYVALVLEEQISGNWTQRDYGNFSKSIDSGGGCITSFSANPATIATGGSSTLSWTTIGTASPSIDNGVGVEPQSGSTVVHPAQTTTYTITANNTANGVPPARQVTVTVQATPPPTISFSASPGSITTGSSSTLSWSTTNASSVTIDNGVGAKPVSGSASVTPAQTTTYTLTATGPGGSATRQATVTVTAPTGPSVTFTGSPTSLKAGDATVLIWTTSNATTVQIDHGVGSVALNGSTTVFPPFTTTYRLTATGPGGTATAQVTVTVEDAPVISFFTAQPSTITAGAGTTLRWNVGNASSVSIDHGIGGVAASGSVIVRPTSTTTYVMTATGPGGTATKSVTVIVGTGRHRAVGH